MMEFLQFTFASFWHFVGTLMLLCAAGGVITRFLSALVVKNGYKVLEPQFRKTIRDAIIEAQTHGK